MKFLGSYSISRFWLVAGLMFGGCAADVDDASSPVVEKSGGPKPFFEATCSDRRMALYQHGELGGVRGYLTGPLSINTRTADYLLPKPRTSAKISKKYTPKNGTFIDFTLGVSCRSERGEFVLPVFDPGTPYHKRGSIPDGLITFTGCSSSGNEDNCSRASFLVAGANGTRCSQFKFAAFGELAARHIPSAKTCLDIAFGRRVRPQ